MVGNNLKMNEKTEEVSEIARAGGHHTIPLDILSDLLTRFIINVPESAKENHIRICFQIELAYWYYLDFYVNSDPKLQGCSLREFAAHVFKHLPFLQQNYDRLKEILDEWRTYKQQVPTYGAILINEDNTHVLLVQSYWAKSSWGFPKGKVNEAEDPAHCAVREVYEETGFDITKYLKPDLYLEAVIHDQLVRLYVIQGVPKSTKFEPRTRYEIKACEWFPISDLPLNKKDTTPKVKMGVSANSFYMVLPFVKRIKNLALNGNGVSGSSVKQKRPRRKSENDSVVKNKSNTSVEVTSNHVSNNNNNNNNRKVHSKRQLFKSNEEFVFSAPSWLNFKFDKAAIMECIP